MNSPDCYKDAFLIIIHVEWLSLQGTYANPKGVVLGWFKKDS